MSAQVAQKYLGFMDEVRDGEERQRRVSASVKDVRVTRGVTAVKDVSTSSPIGQFIEVDGFNSQSGLLHCATEHLD